MVNFSNIYKKKGIDYIFDPGQSLPAWTKELLTELIHGSKIFICNDYELQLTQEKTSMTVDDILEMTETLIVTKGEFGSTVMRKENNKIRSFEIPVARVNQVSDPTGAGDAYRAGLIKGTHDIKKRHRPCSKNRGCLRRLLRGSIRPSKFSFYPRDIQQTLRVRFWEKGFLKYTISVQNALCWFNRPRLNRNVSVQA